MSLFAFLTLDWDKKSGVHLTQVKSKYCCCWHSWHQKIDTSPNFFLYYHRWRSWQKKSFTYQFFFLYSAVDTVDIWKNMNESNKIFKSIVCWTSDAAVDTVDMKKLIHHQICFYCFFTVDAVDIKKIIQIPIFFSLLCRWRRWHLKKHKWLK